ncbi:hypothetical protein BDZ89DRAFT_1060768 [Hymenopellis radicata]|nr:hypothetical protein BDZ89DRAFT_1060768 [Hymenopellis radicata]
MALTLNSELYLPVELIEPIIAHVGRCSPQDLHSLSLVSKVWAPIAQSILFSTVEIHPDSVQTSPTFFGLSDEYHILRRLGGRTRSPCLHHWHPQPVSASSRDRTTHLRVHAASQVQRRQGGLLHKAIQPGDPGCYPSLYRSMQEAREPQARGMLLGCFGVYARADTIALRSCQLKYLSLSRVVFPNVLSLSAALMGLLSNCACLETLLLDAIEPQGPLDLSEVSFPPRPNSSSPPTLRSFILYSEVLNTFPSLLECLSAQSSPVDVSPQFQGEDEAASASTVSFLEKQRHTLEHLSVPQGFLENSCHAFQPQLKSLRIIHEELEELRTFPQLTAITIDINGSPRSALYQLGDHDLRKDHWKAFGTASRQVNVEIVRLHRARRLSDEDDFKTFLGAEDRPVFRLVTTSRPL